MVTQGNRHQSVLTEANLVTATCSAVPTQVPASSCRHHLRPLWSSPVALPSQS